MVDNHGHLTSTLRRLLIRLRYGTPWFQLSTFTIIDLLPKYRVYEQVPAVLNNDFLHLFERQNTELNATKMIVCICRETRLRVCRKTNTVEGSPRGRRRGMTK